MSSLHKGDEPIDGYVLKEKLGSGGYGEVWSADAPGGLTKAIKFVFGTINDDRGATELRSLNRMRKLNYPFILSLERLEIVDGQLIIVTELAQGSLYDRYAEYRKGGFVGIPRDRLLRYMADAADGLDYLCQEHDLQHLDVKPGNLLLVADRVKVADFGLVKDLQSVSQSLMSGMTPTYAAPEMFDGRPGRYSDQYSLAIVYQELLTGTLPFRGRTAAQLANEHINKTPNLDAVPLIERPVLNKALAKKPHMRFGDCREFVRALQDCREEAKAASKGVARHVPAPDGKNRIRFLKSHQGDAATPQDEAEATEENAFAFNVRPVQLQPAMPPLVDASKSVPTRRLNIGLGGSGGLAIQNLHRIERLQETQNDSEARHRSLVFDTDWQFLERLTSASEHPLPAKETVPIRLQSSQYFRQSQSPDMQRVSRRWIFNIPRSQKTEGVRPLGLLAFLDHARRCYDAILDAIEELFENPDDRSELQVNLIASAHGGTGGALIAEFGYLIQQIAIAAGIQVSVDAYLLCAELGKNHEGQLAVASATACLEEIRMHYSSQRMHEPLRSIPLNATVPQPPFDHITLVHGGALGDDREWMHAIEQLVEFLWSQEHTELGQQLKAARMSDQKRFQNGANLTGDLWLGTFGLRRLDLSAFTDTKTSSTRNCLMAVKHWVEIMNGQIAVLRDLDPQRNLPDTQAQANQESPWTQEFLRSTHLTVPAWIRRVMNAVAPADGRTAATGVATPSSSRSSWKEASSLSQVSNEEQLDIESLASQLGVSAVDATQRVNRLLSETRYRILLWLQESSLSTLAGWKHFGQIYREILIRIKWNTERIAAITSQLTTAHERALEQNYQADAVSRESNLQTQTLALEMRFHALAGRLLKKLHKSLLADAQRWERHGQQFLSEMIQVALPYMQELGVHDPDFLSNATELNEAGADAFLNAAMSVMAGHAKNRMTMAWGADVARAFGNTAACKDLCEVQGRVRSAMESWSASGSTPDGKLSEGIDRHPNTGIDTAFFVDRHGWEMTYGNGTAEQTVQRERPKTSLPLPANATLESNLRDEFNRAIPKLVKFGGAVRNVLVISDELTSLLNEQQVQQIHDRCATIVRAAQPSQCAIISVGERLQLGAVTERLWPNSRALQELAHRLMCVS